MGTLNLFSKVNLLVLFTIYSSFLFALYPKITSYNNDNLFKQVQSDIIENSKRIMGEKEILPLQFYTYYLEDNDTIFTVSSRFNLTYDTLATLNHIENQLFFTRQKYIIVPNCQGIYLSKKEYDGSYQVSVNEENLFFYPGKTFTGKERLNFLITPFKSPLKFMYITSGFGNRENPFTSVTEFHSGLDLKAAIGTKIYSPYKGRIDNIGYSEFYGNFLIIVHTSGYSTHYYHLQSINGSIGDVVKQGDYVAKTGNSGRSTGPHLHLEIHLDDEPINPQNLLGDI